MQLQNKSIAIHLLLLALIYIACFGAYTLVNVPFWDDWVLVQYGVDGLWELFKQVGRREHYLMTAPFVFFGNPMGWAVASFISWGAVAFCAYFLLQGLGWARNNAFWAAALTAAMPLNQSRFALAMTPYAISAALFSLALLFVVLSIRRNSLLLRILGAVLLTLSFSTNSFLTMSWLAPAVAFLTFRQVSADKAFWPVLRQTLLRTELLLLPGLYWVSKALFQPVYGLYANYNKFQMGPLEGLVRSFLQLPAQVPEVSTFFPTMGYLTESIVAALAVMSVLALIVALARPSLAIEKGGWRGNWLLVLGLGVAAVLALFPYVMVGIRPAFYALWETRHQTTLAVVAGVLVFAILRALFPARLVPATCTAVLACFVALDLSASRQLLNDVYDSNAIIYSPEIAAIEPGTMVGVFEDNRPYRMFLRHFQFYDMSSMLNAHSPEKALVAMSNYEYLDPETQDYARPGSSGFPKAILSICTSTVDLPQYGFGDAIANGTYAEVVLTARSDPPSLVQSLAHAFGFLFDYKGTVDAAVANLDVEVTVLPFPDAECRPKQES